MTVDGAIAALRQSVSLKADDADTHLLLGHGRHQALRPQCENLCRRIEAVDEVLRRSVILRNDDTQYRTRTQASAFARRGRGEMTLNPTDPEIFDDDINIPAENWGFFVRAQANFGG